jgi:predicted O-methyltransferase YrrM
MTNYEAALGVSSSFFWIKKNFTHPRGWTFAYFRYRMLRPLLKINYKFFKLFNPTTPWTSQASIKIFERILNHEMVGFEYGSGKSTIFFAQRLKALTSIEHNKEWHHLVKKKFKSLNISNVDYYLVPSHGINISIPATLKLYGEYDLKPSDFDIRKEYLEYFSFIARYPDAHFDFVIVDGRARVECSLLAIPKLKRGGIFVLDNSDRPRYKPVFRVLQEWKSITTTTGLFDTTIWFKS